MLLLLRLLLTAVIIFLLALWLPGITITGYGAAILVAIVLSLLRLVVRPVLIILTLPITILTLGLFLLFINAFMVILASYLVSGFAVANIWRAVIASRMHSFIKSVIMIDSFILLLYINIENQFFQQKENNLKLENIYQNMADSHGEPKQFKN